MKRLLLFLVVVGLFAGQASAAMYEMDPVTAASMRQLSVSAGDSGTLGYVGDRPGAAVDKVFGSFTTYGDTMTYKVGFAGSLSDDGGGDSAIATIGILTPGLSGTFDSFLMRISNDNNQTWKYQSYVTYTDGGGGTASSAWTTLAPDGTANVVASIGSDTDFSTVTDIGFKIEWKPSINGDSSSDVYHTSVIPLPGAVLLGMLGLSVAGIKLRKFA